MTQCSLVEAYTERIKGEKAENLEQAIRCCTTVFEVYTKEAYPEGWAMAQHLLAKNYYSRIKGEREGNLEQAIRCYMAALEVYTQEVYPEEWAATQNNLGVAYRERLRGEKAENVERAIQCYIAVLEVRTREAFPFDWAATQINLGSAYYSRLKGKKAENIEQTIRCCMAALEIYTQEALPWNWAMAQHNLGSAYLNRLKGEKAENIKQAIQYYRNAIEMRRSLMIWDDVRDSCWHLGNVYRDEEEWEDAYTAYREAIAAMERIRTEALTEAERTRLIRENIDTFEQLVNCCIRAGRINEAVEYAERGRARNLMEHLIRRDLRWRNVPKSLQDKYEELLSTARNLESLMQRTSTSTTRQPFTTEQVAQIRDDFLQTNQEIEAVLTKIRAIEDFLLDAEPLRFADMQQLAREAQATIIQLMVTQEGTFAFIITGAGEALDEEDIIRVPTFTSDSLSRLVADDWLPSYNSQNEKVWFSCIEQTIEELYTRLFAPIHRRLKELDVRRIVLIPNRGLGILPLHAMSYRENGKKRYLLDDYEITYAPSCGILRRCLDRENEERKKEQFVGVANPTEDLDFSSWEVALIQQHLASKPARVLMGKQATKSAVLEAMPNANLHHFACHGAYKLENPLESRLALADGELTLGEIFASYDAGQAWLVVLSACETGLTDNWRDVSDEYVGLPAGFLYAGAPSVVASLWKIRDFSSALLVTRMYENLLNRDMGRAEALRETQIWLRDLKKEEAEALLQEMAHLSSSTMQMRDIVLLDETEANKTSVDLFAQALSQVAEEEFPEHPYYWAGFQCVGAF
jgi:CHAT domain-containing protein